MKESASARGNPKGRVRNGLASFLVFACIAAGTRSFAQPGPNLNLSDPIGFFTNVASRLVQSQLGLDFAQLQVYPTNQYTPALHRLLQVSANLYDAATNRTYGIADAANGFPTLFRPLFRRADDGRVLIAGYREVTNTDMASGITAPVLADLDTGQYTNLIPALGIPFDPLDRNEPMVAGIPLVIGARKGFPNFNEFGMQTAVQVTRKLEFLRASPDPTTPIVLTNQMYLISISNAFGVEAWNSYTSSYPRNLQMVVGLDMTATITNELGQYVLSNSIPFSNTVSVGSITAISAGSWRPAYGLPMLWRSSFIAPYNPSTNWFFFLPPASYSQSQGSFVVPYQTSFEQNHGFPVPRWYLLVRPRLRFILVDTVANRIVDYVNLASKTRPIDLATALTDNGVVGEPYRPNAQPGSMWVTNRGGGAIDLFTDRPTYGIFNQINASLGTNTVGLVWNSVMNSAFPPGWDNLGAVNFFRTNLLHWGPLPGQFTGPLYVTNRFYAPYAASRILYAFTSWQANDPLVHYTIGDLAPLAITNSYSLDIPPMPSPLIFSNVNLRYEPWGFTYNYSSFTTYQLAVKDPLVTASDAWNFPLNPLPYPDWLGQVHRGTPWQTLYVKSPAIDLAEWLAWTGNSDPADAAHTLPTNDWSIVSLLISLMATNDPRALLSINEPASTAWTSAVDGFHVLTNSGPATFDPEVMYSNSPQAAVIATGIAAARARQTDGCFHQVGDILATPELSVVSPWLNIASQANGDPPAIPDQAYEAVPSQLLPKLRADSIGSVAQAAGSLQLQFTGFDGYAYAVQSSPDLRTWISGSTNTPLHGTFTLTVAPSPSSPQRFYRSVLLP